MTIVFSSARVLGGISLVAVSASLDAASAQDQSTSLDNMEEIVVTAGRREQSIADVQASIEVVSAEKIATFSGASITEALRYSLGVDARSSGSNATVSVRGQIPNAGSAVLILFDGMPRTGKFGISNLNNYPIEDVERIEIIRGPMSSLYGANASAGVINVITKSAGEGPLVSLRSTAGISATKTGEGRESLNIGASLNTKTGKVGHRLSVDYRTVDPFKFDETETEDDLLGIEHLSLTYTGALETERLGNLRWTFESFFQDDTGKGLTSAGQEFERVEEEDRYYGSLNWDVEIGAGVLTLEGSYGISDGSANRSFPSPDEFTDFEQGLVQGRYFVPLGDHNFLLGAGLQRDEVEVSILTEVGKEVNKFVFMQDEWNIWEDVRLTAGLRLDDFDAFGTHIVPRVSIGSQGQGFTWRAGYGEAFRAPSVVEQFSRFNRGRFLIVGSPDIQPEETETWEAAIGWRDDQTALEVIYHNSSITNLIQSALNGQTEGSYLVYEYQNIAEADISGVEAKASHRFNNGFSMNGSYEYLDAINGETKERLNGRAKHTARVNLTYASNAWEFTVRGRHMASLYGIDPNDRTRPAFATDYTTVDFQGSYSLSPNTRLSVGVDNITDEQVPLNWSSTGAIEDPAGRYIYLTLRHAFGG